jgi:hypothetical protein
MLRPSYSALRRENGLFRPDYRRRNLFPGAGMAQEGQADVRGKYYNGR